MIALNRIALLVAYEGTHFYGYQKQPNVRTVQGEIERALQRIHKGNEIETDASGRTDTGVHALGQVLHFDSSLALQPMQWKKALNSLLPQDILVKNAAVVSSQFHARFDAKKRIYRYRVLNREERDLFRRHVTYHLPRHVNVEAIRSGAAHLIGTHDFTSFASTKTMVQNKVRTLYDIAVTAEEDELIFTIIGSGFLHHMVRIIVGTLLEVGTGKKDPNDLPHILRKKHRMYAGCTAPAHGLFLAKVHYADPIFSEKYTAIYGNIKDV